MDIWEYEYEDNVKITTTDGKVYIGTVINICYEDETENGEEMVDIETNQGIFGIYKSEIKEIGFDK